MFFLNRLKPEFSRDPAGRRPNESFAAEYERLTGRINPARSRRFRPAALNLSAREPQECSRPAVPHLSRDTGYWTASPAESAAITGG